MDGVELNLFAEQSKRKAYGAFYTPLRVASLLADWAITERDNVVIEPCFGGCDFLEAIRNRFDELGQNDFDSHIFGCDIDPEAFSHLSSRMNSSTMSGNFLRTDFLAVTPSHFGQEGFDVVIGNPPYIKNDRISSYQKESIKRLASDTTKPIKGRANLWAYFVVHAMTFLRVGGRMALVLPGNFLSADYSADLRKELTKRFARVSAISVAERLFLMQGTEERTVVLLCDGYRHETVRPMTVKYCVNVSELGDLLGTNSADEGLLGSHNNDDYSRLTKEQRDVLSHTTAKINAEEIGKFGSVYIGIVLGDKKYFVRSLSDWKEKKIGATYIQPIVSKFSFLSGLSLKPDDITVWREEDQQCYFLNTRNRKLGPRVLDYLMSNSKQNKGGNSTFKRREIWHQPDDGRIADAFIGCISHFGPRLIINTESIQAANSVYRFDFIPNTTIKQKRVIAISLLTTFSQLSAELKGRPLGSGGLKLEPKDILQILVSIDTDKTATEVAGVFKKIDHLLRCGKDDEGRLLADEFMFNSIIPKDHQRVLREGLSKIRTHRHREKHTDN
jgi:adenine-specific DNA-methyltransferase